MHERNRSPISLRGGVEVAGVADWQAYVESDPALFRPAEPTVEGFGQLRDFHPQPFLGAFHLNRSGSCAT